MPLRHREARGARAAAAPAAPRLVRPTTEDRKAAGRAELDLKMRRLAVVEATDAYKECLAAANARRARGEGYDDKEKFNYNNVPTTEPPAPTATCPGGHLWADNLRRRASDGFSFCAACDEELRARKEAARRRAAEERRAAWEERQRAAPNGEGPGAQSSCPGPRSRSGAPGGPAAPPLG